MSLSIDIGIKNLGWSIIDAENNIDFGIYNVDEEIVPKNIKKIGVVHSRIWILKEFINGICDKNNINTIIIEKQVNRNTIAMELMYLLVTLCSEKVGIENVIIYDPKKKFTTLKMEYDTRNKAHKKKSIEIISRWLQENDKNNYVKLQNYDKKDDISDSIWMNLLSHSKLRSRFSDWYGSGCSTLE
jgi:Holliday junction resolvasome RuvABC endonuclease subunit